VVFPAVVVEVSGEAVADARGQGAVPLARGDARSAESADNSGEILGFALVSLNLRPALLCI